MRNTRRFTPAKLIPAMLAAALLLPPTPPASAEDPLIELLNNRSHDREAVMKQFEHLNANATMTVSPPDGENRPRFQQAISPPPATRWQLDTIALILPLGGSGVTATAADSFYRGCVDGLENTGALLQVDAYSHDGSGEQAVAAYQTAVDDGARFIIGPMQKNSVRSLQLVYPTAPVNTLLLQPSTLPATDATNAIDTLYYVLTIDIGEEASEIARLLSAEPRRVMIIANTSPLSQRQKTAFTAAWTEAGGETPTSFYIHDGSVDWQRLFNQLKDMATAEEEAATAAKEAKEAGVNGTEYEPKPPLLLYAAGNNNFIRQARNFVPQGYDVYANSIFATSSDSTKFLDNLRIMEMPWFVAKENNAALEFAKPQIRTRPPLQQRFYALGADACRAAQKSIFWHDGWEMQGATGTLQLTTAGTFRRRGILSRFQSGALQPLQR